MPFTSRNDSRYITLMLLLILVIITTKIKNLDRRKKFLRSRHHSRSVRLVLQVPSTMFAQNGVREPPHLILQNQLVLLPEFLPENNKNKLEIVIGANQILIATLYKALLHMIRVHVAVFESLPVLVHLIHTLVTCTPRL